MDAQNYQANQTIFKNVYNHIPIWMRQELRRETKLGKYITDKLMNYIDQNMTARFIIYYLEGKVEELIISAENNKDFSYTPNVALPRPDRHDVDSI